MTVFLTVCCLATTTMMIVLKSMNVRFSLVSANTSVATTYTKKLYVKSIIWISSANVVKYTRNVAFAGIAR
jgi:hypothetical protein